jgi:septum formation protein
MIGLVPTSVKNRIGCKSLFLKSPQSLILASTSIYRRALLARVRIPFECVSPGVDETRHPAEDAHALTTRLARAKADAVAAQQPDAWVIGSDQVAVLLDGPQKDRIVGKPGSVGDCVEQLTACSGRTLAFVTAVTVARHCDGSVTEFVDTTRVIFRDLDPATIERYVALESPLDCAGGFKSEGLGITLCDAIDSSDPTALVGLPLIRLCAVLRGAGFDLP